jgi:hypothetical protein
MKKIILAILVVVFSAINIVIAGDKGTSGGLILTQTMDARAIGMAEAFTSIGNSLANIHYNPAGIGFIRQHQASLMFKRGIAEDNIGVIDIGMPLRKGALAVGVLYYSAGDIELIDSLGVEKDVNAQKDYVVCISYGYRIMTNFSVGANVKMLKSTLVEDVSASAYAADFGGLYRIRKFAIGCAVQNVGSKLKYLDKGDALPLTIRAGASYAWNKLIGSADIVKQNDSDIKENIGAEYLINNMFFVRAGYKFGYDVDSMTFGLGFKYFQRFQLDYGLALIDEFDNTHNITFTIKF